VERRGGEPRPIREHRYAGGYLFPTRDSGSADPLWGVRVVDSAAWTHEPGVVDPVALGSLYLGDMALDADGSGDNFRKNFGDVAS
jgi:hypothetical protein